MELFVRAEKGAVQASNCSLLPYLRKKRKEGEGDGPPFIGWIKKEEPGDQISRLPLSKFLYLTGNGKECKDRKQEDMGIYNGTFVTLKKFVCFLNKW